MNRRALLALAGAIGLGACGGERAATRPLTLFAAASLETVLKAATPLLEKAAGGPVALAFAASSTLARQIAQGAPADIFISADAAWMDDLAAKDLIEAASRFDLVGNQLVLVTPADAARPIDLAGGELPQALTDARLAIAEPDAVPAGRYAKAALVALGHWSAVEARTVRAENVRAALAFVARGEAAFGIVYASDAAAEPAVRVAAVFPEATHPRILYPAAMLKGAGPAARAVLEALQADPAQALFAAHGFVRL